MMNTQEISITSLDGGQFNAYLATPATTPKAGILIAQEIFGINEVMRKTAEFYAQAGYVALVPDLFWRQQPGVQLTDRSETDWNQALQLYQGFDENKGIEDLIASLNTLRHLDSCTGQVGTVGFCLGGKLAYLMATRSDAQCNVSYYGVGIENNLNEMGNIKNPLMLHIAEKDEFVSPATQSTIKQQLSDNPLVTVYSYTGVGHAFARIDGVSYNREMADLANNRSLDFFKQYLG